MTCTPPQHRKIIETTAAAIDRLVHHSVILEMTGDSYRAGTAMKRKGEEVAASAT